MAAAAAGKRGLANPCVLLAAAGVFHERRERARVLDRPVRWRSSSSFIFWPVETDPRLRAAAPHVRAGRQHEPPGASGRCGRPRPGRALSGRARGVVVSSSSAQSNQAGRQGPPALPQSRAPPRPSPSMSRAGHLPPRPVPFPPRSRESPVTTPPIRPITLYWKETHDAAERAIELCARQATPSPSPGVFNATGNHHCPLLSSTGGSQDMG